MARTIDNRLGGDAAGARAETRAGGDRDEIAIDRKADVPVGVQLDWALCAQVRDGRLAPGQQLPTLRELAETTGLNVNTVRSVYRRLEQRGLIETQHGSGTFVAATPRRAAALSSIAANAAREARETGLDPRDVAAALYVSPEHASAPLVGDGPQSETSQAARRRALRGQIATLERTVAELEAEHPGIAPAPRRARRGIGPALLTVDELAQVRTTLIRRLAVVQAAIDEHVSDARRERASAKAPAAATRKTAARKPKPANADAQATGVKRAVRPRPSARPAPASG